MTLIKVVPDTEYGLEHIYERFEVPYDMPPKQVEIVGWATAKYAIETYTRLRGWQFVDQRPVELDVSNIQVDLDFTASPFTPIDEGGQDWGSLFTRQSKKAYVVKMWFKTPKVVVTNIDDEVGRADGYLNSDEDPRPKDIVEV